MTCPRPRRCRVCGVPLESTSKSARKCGRCARKRIDAAHAGHVYQRTHVHEWPDGHKTIESGTTCSPDTCPGATATGHRATNRVDAGMDAATSLNGAQNNTAVIQEEVA